MNWNKIDSCILLGDVINLISNRKLVQLMAYYDAHMHHTIVKYNIDLDQVMVGVMMIIILYWYIDVYNLDVM